MTAPSIARFFGGAVMRNGLGPRKAAITLTNNKLDRLFKKLPGPVQHRILNQGAGVEIEVENAVPMNLPGWTRVADNSLRDNGIEYKTNYGQRITDISTALTVLNREWKVFREQNGQGFFHFSERCSVHVHLDARNMSLEEVVSLCMVYTIFEDALFELAGSHRKDNVFCIPIRYSAMNFEGHNFLALHDRWVKYLAFNLCPLSQFGTVEFRHMQGTSDYTKIMTWIILLALMVDYVKRTPRSKIEETIVRMKKESNYFLFLDDIFGPFSGELTLIPDQLDKAVSDAKMFFPIEKGKSKVPVDMHMEEAAWELPPDLLAQEPIRAAAPLFNPARPRPRPRRANVDVAAAQRAEDVANAQLRALREANRAGRLAGQAAEVAAPRPVWDELRGQELQFEIHDFPMQEDQ